MNRHTLNGFPSLASLVFGLCTVLVASGCAPDKRPDPESVAADRANCVYGPGQLPEDTTAKGEALGEDIPLDHIIVIMQENRSFDHYFGSYDGDVDGVSETMTNPDGNGNDVNAYPETDYCVDDVGHGWVDSHVQYNEGANDGFVISNNPNGGRAMGYFTRSDLPYYHSLADNFALADQFFCSLLGPTWPNSMFMYAGTSFGMVSNQFTPTGVTNLCMQLDDVGVDWRSYYATVPRIGIFLDYLGSHQDHISELSQFYVDLENNELPPVVFLDSDISDSIENASEHAPWNPQVGQAFVARAVDAIMNSSIWERSAIILTYDEHGGFFDHVPPPTGCVPDDLAPDTAQPYEGFSRLGFRVPTLVLSPYAKRGYVSHEVMDLTSITRFIALKHNLPAMTGRDANANPLLDMFDFENPDSSVPSLSDAVIDQAQLQACIDEFGR